MVEILAVGFFLLAFLPISLLVLPGAGAVYMSAVVSMLIAFFASILHVVTDIPILVYWVSAAAISIVGTLSFRQLRGVAIKNFKVVASSRTHQVFLLMTALASLLSLASTPPPLGWDARSMWFAIPSWLNGPAEYYLTAQAGGAQTGWSEYPIVGPGSFATLWQLMGVTEDLWAASRLSGLMGVTMTSLAGYLLHRRFGNSKNIVVSTLAFTGLVFSAFFLADGSINNGYMDALQGLAVAATLAAVLAFESEKKLESFAIIAVVSVTAANVKQEGFWFTLAILLIGAIYWAVQNEFWFALGFVPVLATKIIWTLFASFTGMPASGSTSGMGDRIGEFSDAGSLAYQVLATVISGWIIPQHGGVLLLLLVAVVMFMIKPKGGLGADWKDAVTITGSGLGVLTIVLVSYSIGDVRESIDWWLGTSYSRVTSSFEAIVWLALTAVILVYAPDAKKASVAKSRGKRKFK